MYVNLYEYTGTALLNFVNDYCMFLAMYCVCGSASVCVPVGILTRLFNKLAFQYADAQLHERRVATNVPP